MICTLALVASALAVLASDPSHFARAQGFCGRQLEGIKATGVVIGRVTKKAGDAYDCCNQCDRVPNCVAFVEGGYLGQETCELLSKVTSLDKTPADLTKMGHRYYTLFMTTRNAGSS